MRKCHCFSVFVFFGAGLKHLRRSHPRWCGAERPGRRLHPAENRRPGLLRRVNEARHHHTAVSPTRIGGVCALLSALDSHHVSPVHRSSGNFALSYKFADGGESDHWNNP